MNKHNGREIDLKWLVYRILRMWRPLLLTAIIISIIAGCIKITINVSQRPSKSELEQLNNDYANRLSTWEAKLDQLNTELQKLEDTYTEQLTYLQNSVRMKINPLRVHNSSIQLYVNYDYQILADLDLQRIDLSNHVLKAYSTYMTNGEMYHYIIDNLDYDLEIKNLTELLNMTIDYDNNMIYVLVKHYDPVAGTKILQLAQDAIILKSTELNSSIGAHELVITTTSSYESIDFELEKTQKEKQSLLTTLEKEISDKTKTIQNATKPEPVQTYSLLWAMTDALKLLLLTFAASVIVIMLVLIFIYIFSEKLLNPIDIRTRYNLRIITQLPTPRVKKPLAFISAWISSFGGIKIVPEDYDSLVKMAGTSIVSTLLSKEETKAWSTIAFASTMNDSSLQDILNKISLNNDYTLLFAPSILTNADSVEKVASADCVVIIEMQEQTILTDIEKELEALKAWNKPVLGAIITNTDALM